MTAKGMVSLVGAGPGDPELITVRGLARVRDAEVLVYDRLVHPDLVAEARSYAERIFVGKAPGSVALDQRDIEAVLIARACAGKRVVRLKGGDPFVFGRGGEEVAALVAAGVPVEVVSGVTSGIAVPASAGIPVTQRGLSSSVTIVTGHEDPTKEHQSVDWGWLAASNGTLVILMGLRRLRIICERLIAEGRSPESPTAVISAGTLPEQQVVTGTLATVADAATEIDLRSPALIVVGDVVAFRNSLVASFLGAPAATLSQHDARAEMLPAYTP